LIVALTHPDNNQGVADRLMNELHLALEMPLANPQKLGE